jgi:hypothetical protein
MSHQNFCCFSQFRVLISGILDVEKFHTEYLYDILTVNDFSFSGIFSPNGLTVKQGASITWATDTGITYPGFKVCVVAPSSAPSPMPSPPSPAPSQSPTRFHTVNTLPTAEVSSKPTQPPSQSPSNLPTITASPVPAPTSKPSQSPTLDAVSLVSGPCSVAERVCILSRYYPSYYDNDEICEASGKFEYLFLKCCFVSSWLF